MASAKLQLYKHRKLDDGSYPIILQIIKDRKKRIYWFKQYAKESQWNHEENLPNRKHPNSQRLRSLLTKKLKEANDAIIALEEMNRPYTVDDIVNEISDKKSPKSFFAYTENVIQKLTDAGKIGNARVYQNTLNVFKSYRDEIDIDFKHIDYKVLNGFKEYLQQKDSKVNTISNHLRTLRAIYNKAIKDKIVKEAYYPFKDFKIRSEDTKKRAITKDAIDKVRNLNLTEHPDLIQARDYFLFSFYNRGMSFIDIVFLKVKNIQEGRLNYTRRKTGQQFSIKITDKAKEIIDKYNDLSDPDSYIFPVINRPGNEYLDYRNAMRLMNKKLKKIANLADIETPLTTYVSRHSWATIAKRAGIPTAIISEGLGHETEETTQIYLDSFDVEVLDKANEKIIE
ncbi:MAG: phage integrase SAM-like domain-containing protein [Promethearchaeota archaeon]